MSITGLRSVDSAAVDAAIAQRYVGFGSQTKSADKPKESESFVTSILKGVTGLCDLIEISGAEGTVCIKGGNIVAEFNVPKKGLAIFNSNTIIPAFLGLPSGSTKPSTETFLQEVTPDLIKFAEFTGGKLSINQDDGINVSFVLPVSKIKDLVGNPLVAILASSLESRHIDTLKSVFGGFGGVIDPKDFDLSGDDDIVDHKPQGPQKTDAEAAHDVYKAALSRFIHAASREFGAPVPLVSVDIGNLELRYREKQLEIKVHGISRLVCSTLESAGKTEPSDIDIATQVGIAITEYADNEVDHLAAVDLVGKFSEPYGGVDKLAEQITAKVKESLDIDKRARAEQEELKERQLIVLAQACEGDSSTERILTVLVNYANRYSNSTNVVDLARQHDCGNDIGALIRLVRAKQDFISSQPSNVDGG